MVPQRALEALAKSTVELSRKGALTERSKHLAEEITALLYCFEKAGIITSEEESNAHLT